MQNTVDESTISDEVFCPAPYSSNRLSTTFAVGQAAIITSAAFISAGNGRKRTTAYDASGNRMSFTSAVGYMTRSEKISRIGNVAKRIPRISMHTGVVISARRAIGSAMLAGRRV